MAKIMVFAPNLLVTQALADFITRLGHEVQLEPEPPPDLVVWNLSVMQRPFPPAPTLPTIALLGRVNDEDVLELLQLGYRGYFRPEEPPERFAEAIEALLMGEVWIERRVVAQGLARHTRPHLTPKELQVMNLLVLGLSNKQIAQRLNITEGTVKAHVSSILEKYGVRSRRELISSYFQREGAPTPPLEMNGA